MLTQIGALEELGDGRFLAKLARVAVLPGRRRPGHRRGRASSTRTTGARAELVEAYRARATTRCSLFEGDGLRRGRPRARGRAVDACASRRWRTTPRRTCCTRRCARCSATTSRQAGSAVRPGQAALRLHAPAGADAGGARARSSGASTRRSSRTCPVRTFVTPIDEARQARRDDALRREVRRRRARGRDRRRTRASSAAARTCARPRRSGRS